MSQADPGFDELAVRRSTPPLVTIGGHIVNLSPGGSSALRERGASGVTATAAGAGRGLRLPDLSHGSPPPFVSNRGFSAALAGTLLAVALFIALDVLLVSAIRRLRWLSRAARTA